MQKLVFKNGNGIEIDLTDFTKYGITDWSGLSNTTLNIQSQKVPFYDGSVFLDVLLNDRTVSVKIAVNDNGNLATRYELKRELIAILNPKLGEGVLTYTNDYLSKQLNCIPNLPIFANRNSNGKGTLKADVSFTACNPYWEDTEETVTYISKGLVTLHNIGDVPAPIKADFFTSSANRVRIDNLTTEQSIKINGALTASIEVNTNEGQKSVMTQGMDWEGAIKDTLRYVCFIPELNLYMAVGDVGAIITSQDGVKWERQKSGVTNGLNSVCYSAEIGLFVVVGEQVILTSADGIEWDKEEVTATLMSVCYSGEQNIFVAVGSNDYPYHDIVYVSSDGINWRVTLSHIDYYMLSVCYSKEKNLFVAVGYNVMTSPDGETWTEVLAEEHWSYGPCCYSEELGIFVVFGYYTLGTEKKTFISSDGETWTEHDLQYSLTRMIYSSVYRLFYAFYYYDGIVYTSSDGITWAEQAQLPGVDTVRPRPIDPHSICYSAEQNLFLIVGNGGAMWKSFDGETWTVGTEGSNIDFTTVCYYNNLYIVGGSGSGGTGGIYTSPDGITWTSRTSTDISISQIKYFPSLGQFIAVGGTILKSPDGITWTDASTDTVTGGSDICYSAELGMYIIVGYGGSVSTSSDGETWSSQTIDSSYTSLNAICYSAERNLFVIVGQRDLGVIYTSPDGETWTKYEINSYHFQSVCYSAQLDMFVAVGQYRYNRGAMVISKDGINWTVLGSGDGYGFTSVTYSPEMGTFLTVGYEGQSYTSTDGINWVEQGRGTSNTLNEVYYSTELKKFLAVGEYKTFVTSYFTKKTNAISLLSNDSDMGFSLDVGENKLLLSANGNVSGRVIYRNRYIGV